MTAVDACQTSEWHTTQRAYWSRDLASVPHPDAAVVAARDYQAPRREITICYSLAVCERCDWLVTRRLVQLARACAGHQVVRPVLPPAHALNAVIAPRHSKAAGATARPLERRLVNAFERGNVPQTQRAVAAARHSDRASGMARHRGHLACVTLQGGKTLPLLGTPEQHTTVSAAAEEEVAGGGEGQGIDGSFVAEQRSPLDQLLGVKHIHYLVIAARCKILWTRSNAAYGSA